MSIVATLERAVIALERIATALESKPANDTKTPRKPALHSEPEITELMRARASKTLRKLGLG